VLAASIIRVISPPELRHVLVVGRNNIWHDENFIPLEGNMNYSLCAIKPPCSLLFCGERKISNLGHQ
jgi:hypothetical protein